MKSRIDKIRFSKKILTSFVGILSLSLLTQHAAAQIGSASVQGMIASHLQPQPDVEVIAKNIDNGYSYRALTQQDGTYAFRGLTPGRYKIFLQASTAAPEDVVLKVGQSVSLDIEIDKPITNADKVDEVLIVGSKLKIKSSGGEIGTNVSLEQINKLPQSTRNFLAFADLAPGVQFNQASDGSTSIKGGAQSADAINVFIDGVGQKNYVLRGGITGQDSSRGNPFPQSAIGEYKVITQNYSAEYDQISSAAIVAVTKSGTNEFHGGLFVDYTDEGLRKPRPSERDSKKVESQQKQFGFNVGGPIIKDKMHFFFAYEGKNNADPKDIIPEGGVPVADLPSALQAVVGGASADFKEDLYFGKLTYLISDQQKVELTTKVRKEIELTGIGGVNTVSYGTDKKNDETRVDLSHNWRADNWLNDIHLLYEDNSWSPRPHSIGNGLKYSNGGGSAILNIGGGPDFQDKGQSGWGIQEDFTYLALQGHTIKTGIKYKSIELHAKEQQPYNPQYEYNVAYNDGEQPFKVKWGAPLSGIGDGTAKTDNKQFGIYLQDEWIATSNLTVNAGLRWDYEESDSFLDYKTPADVTTGIANWEGIKKSNININDYVSDGNNRNSFKDAWQPRVGFSYKFNDEHDITLFGGVGRAYDRNLFDNLQLEVTKSTFPTYEVVFQTADPSHPCAGPECVPWDPRYLTPDGLTQLKTGDKGAGREVFMVNNNLKTPYSDQFSFGLRGNISDEWKGEVSLSRIVSKDGFAWLLANRREDGSFFAPGATWGAPDKSFSIPGFGSALIGDNGIETKANSLYVKLEKPKENSSWGLTLAYTYTDPTTNRKSGEVFALDYPTLDDYGIHQADKVPNHRLVITSIIGLPWEIDFSAKLNLQTDQSYYGQDCRPGWNACKFDTFIPKGAFTYKQFDIAFSKNISTNTWAADSSLTLRLDVLNLFNTYNYDAYNDWFGGANENLPENFGKPTDALAGPTRNVKLGINWNF